MKIRKIKVSEIDGFKLGNAENTEKGTGCTVIICEDGAVGGVDVRGGAPATRETDLLRFENTVDAVNAVVLSGGSAFGLESACGVMNELSERGVGFKLGDICVPIVCGASLFDLAVGDSKSYPDKDMGRQACRNAYENLFSNGNSGAGTGASVGKLHGMNRAMKTGLGTFACADDKLQVGAIVAVNAVGDIYNGAGNIIAGLRTEEGSEIYGTIKSLKPMVHDNASSSEGGEEVKEKPRAFAEINDDKVKTKSEIAAAIRNAFSNKAKNKVVEENVEKAKAEESIPNDNSTASIVDFYSSDEMIFSEDKNETSEAAAAVNEEQSISEKEALVTENKSADIEVENKYSDTADDNAYQDPDKGYDIPFNTTVACLITNAKLSKSQCNKLASMLHDAYARSIKPVHTTMDGDTVFVLTTGKQEVNFDAFAALATDVLQYAIIDGAMSAKAAYGLPSASDIIR